MMALSPVASAPRSQPTKPHSPPKHEPWVVVTETNVRLGGSQSCMKALLAMSGPALFTTWLVSMVRGSFDWLVSWRRAGRTEATGWPDGSKTGWSVELDGSASGVAARRSAAQGQTKQTRPSPSDSHGGGVSGGRVGRQTRGLVVPRRPARGECPCRKLGYHETLRWAVDRVKRHAREGAA
jgi:hypothetical protein